jgi:hypothetical protein
MAERRKPIKVGDRVVHDVTHQHGIVKETSQREAQIHWGTVNRVEILTWEQKSSLTRSDERVVNADEIAERQKRRLEESL